jgi:hypothetical protein
MSTRDPRKRPEYWLEGWLGPGHTQWRTQLWREMQEYLGRAPGRLLDIGAGVALEARLWHLHHGTEIWLIDGNNRGNRPEQARTVGYSDRTEEFCYYVDHEHIHQVMRQSGVRDYHLIDAEAIQIPAQVRFDLITSFSSCGVHYPLTHYRDLVIRHSGPDTVCIFDIRNRIYDQMVQDEIDVIHVLSNPRPQDRMSSHRVAFRFRPR